MFVDDDPLVKFWWSKLYNTTFFLSGLVYLVFKLIIYIYIKSGVGKSPRCDFVLVGGIRM